MNKKTQLNMVYAGIAVFVILLLQSWLAERGVEVIPCQVNRRIERYGNTFYATR
jgi:hypothetical protein